MPTIPLNRINATWIRFCQRKEDRQSLINEFCRQQPFIHEYVTQQDKEWFPDGGAQIRTLALFVWLVFIAEHQGKVPIVTREQMARLLSEGIAKMDLVDAESEIRTSDIVRKDLRRPPQIEFSMFLMDCLTHKEDCFELIPKSTQATHSHLDIVIRALDAVTYPTRADAG